MISIDMLTPQETRERLARRARALRLARDLSQRTLAAMSGVSYGSLKKFERTGKISLEALVKLAMALGRMGDFKDLFAPPPATAALSLDELIADYERKRGRK